MPKDTPTLRFAVDTDRIEFDEVIAIQSGQLKESKAVMVRFLVDSDGNPLSEAEANKVIGSLPLSELASVLSAFGEALTAAMQSVLPNG